MLVNKVYQGKTVIINIAIACVEGRKPIIGFAKEVEEKWKKLKAKMGIRDKRKRYVNRAQSFTGTDEELDKLRRMHFRRGPDMGQNLSKFKQMETQLKNSDTDDVFSPNWKPPKFDKNAPDYGRPKPGSLTEQRGIAAGHHIGKEIIRLCEVITDVGDMNEDGTVTVLFGPLFEAYVRISDKVVGMLMRARKHKMVYFQSEMLYQRRDELEPIILLRPLEDVKKAYEESDDPAVCLNRDW